MCKTSQTVEGWIINSILAGTNDPQVEGCARCDNHEFLPWWDTFRLSPQRTVWCKNLLLYLIIIKTQKCWQKQLSRAQIFFLQGTEPWPLFHSHQLPRLRYPGSYTHTHTHKTAAALDCSQIPVPYHILHITFHSLHHLAFLSAIKMHSCWSE